MISLIFSALPDIFCYSILHHHPLCLARSLSLSLFLLVLPRQTVCLPLLFSFSPATYLFSLSHLLLISHFHFLELFFLAVSLSLTQHTISVVASNHRRLCTFLSLMYMCMYYSLCMVYFCIQISIKNNIPYAMHVHICV